jgi:DNA replication protein DnaC
MLINQTKNKLAELGLNGMLRAFENQLKTPESKKLSFEERFGMIVDTELSDRGSRRINRLKKSARLRYSDAALEDIDYRPTRKLDQSLIMSLADCSWVNRNQNVIVTGATGTGKSWFACGLGTQACRNNYSVQYITATQLFENLAMARIENTLPKIRRALIKTQVLIIDDLGIGGIDPELGPILLDIIDQQSLHGALIITSQYPTSKWYDLFTDPTIADAILDRIIHQSHNIVLKGESMRKSRKK